MIPRSRKGVIKTAMTWLPRLVLFVVAVVVIAMLARYFSQQDIDDAGLQRTSYFYRIYYDGNLITYKDPGTGRVYPGVIDLAKFRGETLDATFGTSGSIASMLTLRGACVTQQEIYNDKATYEQYLPFARFGTLGPGSATLQEEILPVTIQRPDGRCAGTLNVTIVRLNS